MLEDEGRSGSKHRGRPRSGDNLNLYKRLMAATEKGLLEKVHSELTAKEIAAAAGSTEGMIQYYFGSKDQLSITVLQQACDEVCTGLRRLKEEILHLPGNPTWHLVRTVFDLAAPHSATTRLHVTELLRKTSVIRDEFINPKAFEVYAAVSEVITVLVDAGIYSRELDVRYATFVMTTLIEAPVVYAFALPARGFSLGEFETDRWIGLFAGILDRYFRDPVNLSTIVI